MSTRQKQATEATAATKTKPAATTKAAVKPKPAVVIPAAALVGAVRAVDRLKPGRPAK